MQVNLRIRRRIHAKRNHREQVKGLFSLDMSPYHKQIPWVGAQGSWGTLGHLLRIYTVASLLRKAHRLFLTACRNRNAIYEKIRCTCFCVSSNTGVARVIEMWPLSLALRLTRSFVNLRWQIAGPRAAGFKNPTTALILIAYSPPELRCNPAGPQALKQNSTREAR